MTSSPIIFNKKSLEKRKKDIYKKMKNDFSNKKYEKMLKIQADKEVALIKSNLKKNTIQCSYDINILICELIDFINK